MIPRITRFPPSIGYRILEAIAFPLMVLAVVFLFHMLDPTPDKPAQPASYLPQSE
jgi:hypothetical protein